MKQDIENLILKLQDKRKKLRYQTDCMHFKSVVEDDHKKFINLSNAIFALEGVLKDYGL